MVYFKGIQIQAMVGLFKNSEEPALENSQRKSLKMLLGTTSNGPWTNERSHITENRIALVCSARSAATKEEGTTNRYFTMGSRADRIRLLQAAEEALIPGSTTHVELVNIIREDHIDSAKKLIRDREILGRVEREIDFECKRLEDFLNAAQVCPANVHSDKRLSMRLVQKQKILLLALGRD
jgi:hypothetical protein